MIIKSANGKFVEVGKEKKDKLLQDLKNGKLTLKQVQEVLHEIIMKLG